MLAKNGYSPFKTEPLAIIAGRGMLPQILINDCQKRGQKFALFLLESENYEIDYSNFNPITLPYSKISTLVEKVKEKNIKNIVSIGSVSKPNFSLFRNLDKKSVVLLSKIVAKKLLGDDAVLRVVIDFFEKEGLTVLNINQLLDDLVAQKGVLTRVEPNKEELADIEIAVNAIKVLSKFDIGQAVVVAQKQIIGVEAVEGTDELIKRCGNLTLDYKKDAILVKLKKIGQTRKADLPVIGVETIRNIHQAGLKGVAIEAVTTLILEKTKVVELANELGIFIVAVKI